MTTIVSIHKKTAEAKELIKSVEDIVERIKKVMDFGKTDWTELSEEDLQENNHLYINCLCETDYRRAYRDGLVTQEQMEVIQDFEDWNQLLGGFDE